MNLSKLWKCVFFYLIKQTLRGFQEVFSEYLFNIRRPDVKNNLSFTTFRDIHKNIGVSSKDDYSEMTPFFRTRSFYTVVLDISFYSSVKLLTALGGTKTASYLNIYHKHIDRRLSN